MASPARTPSAPGGWPRLPAHEEWSGTLETLHMLTQVAGKVRVAWPPPSTTGGRARSTRRPGA